MLMGSIEGNVIDYNGYTGKIVYDDKEFLLLDSNILSSEIISTGDVVSFVPEIVNDILIARFVEKVVNNK